MTSYDTAWWQAHPEHMQEQRNGPQAWAYEAQEAAIADVLRPLGGINSVLEVGCGYGRVTKVVYDTLRPAEYVPSDASPASLEGAEEYLRDRDLSLTLLDLDAAPGPETRPAFDLVVASEVLMHRTPEKVEGDIEFLAGSAKRYVLTVDWHEERQRDAEGCWQHDYAALFGKYGFVTVTPLPKIRQAIYLTAIA